MSSKHVVGGITKFRAKMLPAPKVSIACVAPLICTKSARLRLRASTVPVPEDGVVPGAVCHLSEPYGCRCQNTNPEGEGEEPAPRLIFWKRTD